MPIETPGPATSRLQRVVDYLDRFADRWRDGLLRRWIIRTPFLSTWKLRRIHVRRYIATFNRAPDLRNPRLFTEYITARVISDRNPLLKIANDKLAVRALIDRTLGPGHTVPLLAVWRPRDAFDWSALKSPFVAKPSHMSGPHWVVHDPARTDLKRVGEEAKYWLERDYFDRSFEWGYRGIPRRLIVEPLLRSPDGGSLVEVNVFTFHGQPKLLFALVGHKTSKKRCFAPFDIEGDRIDLHGKIPLFEDVLDEAEIDRIHHLVRAARVDLLKLASGIGNWFPFVRVDFYLTDRGPLIGELTTYPAGGRGTYKPEGWDERLGDMLRETAATWDRSSRRKRGDWPCFERDDAT